MLANIFSPKSEKECYLILDFAQTNLKLLLVSAKYNKVFQYPVFSHKILAHDLSLEQILDGDFASLRKEITKSLSDIYNRSPFHIISCICGIEDAFFESQFYTSSFQLDPESQIDMGKLQNILQQAQFQARQGVLKKAQKKFKDQNLKLIQSDLIDIRIDNQSVQNPLGLSGNNMSIIFYNAFCQQKLFESLSNLTEYIGFQLENLLLQPLSQAQISQGKQKQLVIEISHSKTSVTLATDGRLLKNAVLEFSTQSIIDQFQSRFDFTAEQAKGALISYCQDNFTKEYRDLRKAVLMSATRLAKQIKEALSKFKLYDLTNIDIKLMGGGAYIPEITEVLEQEFQKHNQIFDVQLSDLQFLCDPTNQLTDPGLIATAASANKYLSDKNKDSTSVSKANINKILRLTTTE